MAVSRFSFGACMIPSGDGTNYIYEGCCQRITCSVENIHNTRLTIEAISMNFSLSYWSVTIVSINGFPPSYPFQVNSHATFQLVFDVCGSLFPDLLTVNFQTTEHGLDIPQSFYFDRVAFGSDVTPGSYDFGTVVQFTQSTPAPFTITNSTTFDVDYSFSNSPCPNEFSFADFGGPFSFPITIAAGGNKSFDVIWTPTGPSENLSCSIDFQVLNADDSVCVGLKIGMEGLSTPAPVEPCDCLCLDQLYIQTVGGPLGELMNPVLRLPNDTTIFTESAICDKKRITYFFNYANTIDTGFKVWFNPWLFAFTCDFDSKYPSSVNAPPPQGWFIEVNSAVMTYGGGYVMNLIGTGSNQFSQTNFDVVFGWGDANNFQIQIDYYHISDIENWIANSSLLNNPKWRRNSVNAPNPSMGSNFVNLIGSVYNSNKKLCSLTYIRDPNKLVLDQPTECFVNNSLNYTSRFYNMGLYGGASEFSGWSSSLPTFELTRMGIVNNFSTIEKTKVTFRVKIGSMYGGLGNCVFQLFDETGTNNTVDFLTNYDSSRAAIETLSGSSIIDNHIVRPSQITAVGGDDYEISAHVGTTISSTGKYRMAAIVYSADGTMVNTFISEQILVTSTPDLTCDICVIETDSTFNQYYHSESSNCIRPTLKERIQHLVTISEGSFIDCLEKWGGKSFSEYLNRISLNIYYKNASFPTSTQTTFFMFGQHVSNRVPGFPGGWQNLNDMIVADVAGNVTTNIMTRVRWENTPFDGSNVFVANTNTFMNRTNAGFLGNTYVSTLGINNNWSNATINFEYIYQFDLSSLLGIPYIINQVKSFDVNAIPNEPNISPIDSHLTGFEIQGKTTGGSWATIQNPFCPNDFAQIRVKYSSNINGDFIFFMEPYLGGNVNNIMESEIGYSPNGFPMMLNVPFISPDFTGNEAFAELDISTLSNGQYIVCGYLSLK